VGYGVDDPGSNSVRYNGFFSATKRPGRSQWPRGLRRSCAAACLLRLWVRIPPWAYVRLLWVLSGRGLCVELITRPEESYRLWCVVVCDPETSWMRRPWPTGGCRAKNKHKPNVQTGPETRPSSYSFITLPRVKRRGVKFTIHLRLRPRLRMSGAIPLLPYIPSWRAEGQLYRFINTSCQSLADSCHILPNSLYAFITNEEGMLMCRPCRVLCLSVM